LFRDLVGWVAPSTVNLCFIGSGEARCAFFCRIKIECRARVYGGYMRVIGICFMSAMYGGCSWSYELFFHENMILMGER